MRLYENDRNGRVAVVFSHMLITYAGKRKEEPYPHGEVLAELAAFFYETQDQQILC
jgi:hypothetical protein